MSTPVIVYVLTGLAGLVIALTRLRLGGSQEGAGRADVGQTLLNVHTGCGVLGLAAWVTFLVGDEDSFAGGPLLGVVALGFLWLTAIAGLLILLRWLPSHGKHSSAAVEDTWSEGPGLSLLAHFGMLVGVTIFTLSYLTGVV